MNTLFAGSFVKMHALGNDFVVLDLLSRALPLTFDFAAFALAACDRHLGIGGDGLLTLERATTGEDVRMRMWNPDGTEDMCGNGLRCVALLAHMRGFVGEAFSVQTLNGTRRAFIEDDLVRVSMGAPNFAPASVPLAHAEPLIEGTIELDGRTFAHATSVSTGSTHTIIFGDEPVDEETFGQWSPRLEVAPLFPQRTSVLWAHRVGESTFGVRIWERGAGETLACGTGACAVAVAARVTKRAGSEVKVRSRGGELRIWWDEDANEVWKTGSAKIVFEGVWNPE